MFWLEWMLAIHRAVWFPFHWATGLERPAIAVPVEFAPGMLTAPTLEGHLKAADTKRAAS